MIKTASLRERRRATRASARLRRNGCGSLVTHCMAQGLRKKQAESVAGTLRNKAKELEITGTPHVFHVGGETREGSRYTQDEVARMALIYKPRLVPYQLAVLNLRTHAS